MNTLIPTNLTVGDRPVNVYEWETKDVVGWLRENDLFDYTAIFEMQKVDGEQLLKTNEMMAIHEFKIEDDDDRKNFMQQLDSLKEYHSMRRKSNVIQEADSKMGQESSQIIPTINFKIGKTTTGQTGDAMNIHNGEDGEIGIQNLSDSSILQFEDNDSLANQKLLEEEIKMLEKLICQNNAIDTSSRAVQQQHAPNDQSQKYGMTISKPFVLSYQNLGASTASINYPIFSQEISSQQTEDSVSMGRFKMPHMFDQGLRNKKITEALSAQENNSGILEPTLETRLSQLSKVSLILRDRSSKNETRFFEIMGKEAFLQTEEKGIFSGFEVEPDKKLARFSFSSHGDNWEIKACRKSPIVALQVLKQVLHVQDTFIAGNHTLFIRKIDNIRANQAHITLQIGRLEDPYFSQIKMLGVDEEGVSFGKNKKCSFQFVEDKAVSSVHCKMFYDNKQQAAVILDNTSTNGTWIKIKENQGEQLEAKMHIQIDLKYDIAISDICRLDNLEAIKENLQSPCIKCRINRSQVRHFITKRIDMCLSCAKRDLDSAKYAQIVF